MLESNSSFLIQELQNKQITTEKHLDNNPSNSEKVKTVKHLSKNQKQKVHHKGETTRKIT